MGLDERIPCGKGGVMLQLNNLKVNIAAGEDILPALVAKKLKINVSEIKDIRYLKRSIDARNKADIKYILSVAVSADDEQKVLKRLHDKDVFAYKEIKYTFEPSGDGVLKERPVIIGAGPAGLFCAYNLTRFGFRPLIIERGGKIADRVKSVSSFFKTGELDTESNIQFGEGGAGTFSDGKLNTLIKDENGRIRFIYKTFVDNGADPDILWQNKPHIGTDVLRNVISGLRNEIIKLGGEFLFDTKMTGIVHKDGRISGIVLSDGRHIKCGVLVIAPGHSARDTFHMLYDSGIIMEQKAFAIGVRVEHLQEDISRAQYGENYTKLPPADYKLTNTCSNGRGTYSFCMCPGGHVVNASSEKGMLAVNGMSYRKRDSLNANSAIAVTVGPGDFGGSHPLAGTEFQRKYEKLAFSAGHGEIPVQRFADFKKDIATTELSGIRPTGECSYRLSNLNDVLPYYVKESLVESMGRFGNIIKGFDNDDALFSGVETRTSSPVRIVRDERLESNIKGIYPCGEGAGYAGGITSAAVDGLRVSEMIMSTYKRTE